MIIIKFLETLKKFVPDYEKYTSFKEVLKSADKLKFQNKDHILGHFNSIIINENPDKSLCILKYDTKTMMKKPWDDFYKVTRGLTIDWRNCSIVLYPFDKFFELDEHPTTSLTKVRELYNSDAIKEVTEKIDGSLIIVRYYNDEIICSSSGALVGEHVNIAMDIIKKNEEYIRFIKAHSDYTIMFEMKNTKYPQLIKYNENSVAIIGMRNMNNFELLYRKDIIELTKGYDVKVVETRNYTLNEMIELINKPDLPCIEGFVLRIGEFMVKIKNLNFILANRFMGEPERNFNMIVQCINEGRIEYVRPMVRTEYSETFDMEVKFIERYVNEKETLLNPMFNEFDTKLSTEEFISIAKVKYPKYCSILIQMKLGHSKRINSEDIKLLKPFAKYFGCVSHTKYSELNNIPLSQVEKDIAEGKIQYINKYPTREDKNKFVYIINKWQFVDLDKIHFAI